MPNTVGHRRQRHSSSAAAFLAATAGRTPTPRPFRSGIYLRTTSGALTLLSTLSTSAAGAFTGSVTPTESGSLVARVHSVAGYADADSADVLLQVSSKLT